jgi:hypothetical protein
VFLAHSGGFVYRWPISSTGVIAANQESQSSYVYSSCDIPATATGCIPVIDVTWRNSGLGILWVTVATNSGASLRRLANPSAGVYTTVQASRPGPSGTFFTKMLSSGNWIYLGGAGS